MNIRQFLVPISTSLLVTGCNPVKSTAEAEAAVIHFHVLFDGGEYEKIYDTAHPDFRSVGKKEDALSFMKSVREKLGTVKSTSRTGWQANTFNMQTNVTLSYATEFEHGAVTETFTYRIRDNTASLIAWRVYSNALAVAPAAPSTTTPLAGSR